jgi:hypothetical protein
LDSNTHYQQHQVDINNTVSDMLAIQSNSKQILDIFDRIETANTSELIDIMIGLVSKGKENLTEEDNKIRVLISDELKNRSLEGRM